MTSLCCDGRDRKLEAQRAAAARRLSQSQSNVEVLEQFSQCSELESLQSGSAHGDSVHDVMLRAYTSIGDIDAVYGCPSKRRAEPRARIRIYEHEGDWSRALNAYDVILNDAAHVIDPRLTEALYKQGSTHLLDAYMSRVRTDCESDDVREIRYQSALRNAKWDLHTSSR